MKALKKLSKLLSDNTAVFVIAVAVITYFCPVLFSWVGGFRQTIVLGIIMFGMGLTLTKEDFKILAQRPLDIFIGALAQYTIMPLIGWGVGTLLHLPDEIKIGLILVGCCPGGISSNIMSFLCKGDVPFSVGMTTASTFLAPVMTPFLVKILTGGVNIEVDAAGMFLSIIESVIIPVLIGFALNYFFGEKEGFKDVQQVMPGVSVAGLACIVGGVIAAQGKNFISSGIVVFIAVFLHNALGYFLGYCVGKLTRMSKAKKRTISIEVGMQNAGLATSLATKHFAALPAAPVACAVACVWHSISGALLAQLFAMMDKKKSAKDETKAPEEATV